MKVDPIDRDARWKGFAPAIRKSHPYGICWTFNCWGPAVLENTYCKEHQDRVKPQ